jgi:diguanylate cyclase (GGDEF)-like protein
MFTPPIEFYRLDPLTGCHNFLSFVETLAQVSSGEQSDLYSILYLDMNYLKILNETRGYLHGDSVLRWLGIVLQEESNLPTYRIGGDEFTVILTGGTHVDHEELLLRIFSRLNKEGELLDIPSPAAKIALIHYPTREHFSINDVLFHLWEAILDVKTNRERSINKYMANDLPGSMARPPGSNRGRDESSPDVLRWIANQAIYRILHMGKLMDAAQKESFIDSISGLPNMRAALMKIEKEVTARQPFAVLVMDGDELRCYNNISYAAGDDMIQKISVVLSEKLRPGDFVARWRTGDEFLAVLPNTTREGAIKVGERFCSGVRDASRAWPLPISITIGIATFPEHGNTVHELVDHAESAMKTGKEQGKDRVIAAG